MDFYLQQEQIDNLEERFKNFQDVILLIILPLWSIIFFIMYIIILKLKIKSKYMSRNLKLLMQNRLNQGKLAV